MAGQWDGWTRRADGSWQPPATTAARMTRRQKWLAVGLVAVLVLLAVAAAVGNDGVSPECESLRLHVRRLTLEIQDRDAVGADSSEQRVDLRQTLRAVEAECG